MSKKSKPKHPTDPRLDRSGKPLPQTECPVCKKRFDSASSPDNDAPRPHPGDVTICINCGSVLVFGEDMVAKEPNLKDMLTWGKKVNTMVEKLQKAIRSMPPQK